MRREFRNRDWNDPQWQDKFQTFQQNRQKNRAFFGIAVAVLGVLWILKIIFKVYVDPEVHWPFILLLIGTLIGIKSNFRNNAWWILCLIGGIKLAGVYLPNQQTVYIWPVALIIAGVAMALKPRNKSTCSPGYKIDRSITAESNLAIDVTFGGRKEAITSKDFRSGNVSVTFGGCELNFMQADITESPAILDLKVSFGGVEIILPSHWEVQNEISPSFGNVEDERTLQTAAPSEHRKKIILRGSCSFGNVEIKSY